MDFKKFRSREIIEAFEWTEDIEPDGHIIRYATKENVEAYNKGEVSDINTSMMDSGEYTEEIKVPYIIYNGQQVLGGNGNVMIKTKDKRLYAMNIDEFNKLHMPFTPNDDNI
mgnify:CR=1 FL=1